MRRDYAVLVNRHHLIILTGPCQVGLAKSSLPPSVKVFLMRECESYADSSANTGSTLSIFDSHHFNDTKVGKAEPSIRTDFKLGLRDTETGTFGPTQYKTAWDLQSIAFSQ